MCIEFDRIMMTFGLLAPHLRELFIHVGHGHIKSESQTEGLGLGVERQLRPLLRELKDPQPGQLRSLSTSTRQKLPKEHKILQNTSKFYT